MATLRHHHYHPRCEPEQTSNTRGSGEHEREETRKQSRETCSAMECFSSALVDQVLKDNTLYELKSSKPIGCRRRTAASQTEDQTQGLRHESIMDVSSLTARWIL